MTSKEYTVDALGDGVYSVHISAPERITQMVWSVAEVITFCAGLNEAGFTPANDWTVLL